ncbi:MAG: flagellar basal body rod protein FlgC, partial [Myxococcales bacterium]|nr:flagellar basal body rod protein FlgC [Myxococcales bacterium]
SEDGQPYRAKQVVFSAQPVAGPAAVGVKVTDVVESAAPLRLVYEPNNPAANAEGYVEMPNVNVINEMVDMLTASRSYEANVTAIQAIKGMAQSALEIGS